MQPLNICLSCITELLKQMLNKSHHRMQYERYYTAPKCNLYY